MMNITNTRLRRLATNWIQQPADWVPLTDAERKELARRLEDAQQPDAAHGKDCES